MADRGAKALTDEDAKLFIGNLSYHTREERLLETFGKYGSIKECRVALEPGSERSRGYAFVTMDDPEDALMCVKNISGQDVDGRLIKVEVATGIRGRRDRGDRDRGDRDRDRGDRHAGGRDRDFNRDHCRGGGRDFGRGRSRDRVDGRDPAGNSWDRDRDNGGRDRSRSRDGDRSGNRSRDRGENAGKD